MDPENVKQFGWAVAAEEALMRELEAEQESERWLRDGELPAGSL